MATYAWRSMIGILLLAAPALAVEPTSASSTAPGAEAVRRDAAGRTGISPSWEAIKRGDDAYVVHNLDGAIHEYRAAIEARPQNPVAHYRLACALIAQGDFKQAQESLDAALRFSKSDPVTASKTLFVMADLKERQQDYRAALTAWKSYSAFAASHAETKTFAASSESRQARLTDYIKLAEQSAQVKQRIDERLQAAELQRPVDRKAGSKDDAKK